ncbi:MAG: hypothetical protein ACTSO9_10685 [Candidatus Helarchaeota archaeon]
MSYDYEFWQEFLDFFLIKDAIAMICEHNKLKTNGTKKEMINRILDFVGEDLSIEKIASLFPKEDLKIFSEEKEGRISGTRAEILKSVINIFKARKN